MTTQVNEKSQEKKQKPSLKYLRDKDREPVKGIFRFHECPGGTLMFSYKAYREDPVENFTLTDGQVYTLPLGVAKHLNKNCWYPQYEYVTGMPGEEKVQHAIGHRIAKKVRRCSFQSLEFVDIDDLNPAGSVLEVEALP